MDRRFLIIVALSAVFAACVAGVLFRLAAKPRSAKVPTREVVVAAANLPAGTKIVKTDLKLVPMPETMLPRNSFSRIEDVEDRIATAAMFIEEPVLNGRIAVPGAVPGLAPMIAEGQRAVSVRVNDVIGVAGFAQPGAHVDVLVTGRPPGSNDSVTRTVLQNMLVLSAGPVLQAEPKGQAINATVVTLQVSPQQAEILTLASGEGHIQLVLRNPGDSGHETTPGTVLSALYGARAAADSETHPAPPRVARKTVAPPVQPVAATPPPRTVEVVRGTKKSVDPVEFPPDLNNAVRRSAK